MKLLIITQVLDRQDTVLGFFENWVKKLAEHFESVSVICLKKGENHLPKNVKVFSLGKETGRSRLKYLWRFYKFIWRERTNYDAVFVHMNQEYILLAGWWWWLAGKKVYLWRNHYAGNWLTDFAAFFCQKVFCTSRYSYTAKYKKTILMPVGIDTDFFKPDPTVTKIPNSILFLGRIAPAKKPDLLIAALKILAEQGMKFEANFYGDALPQDSDYYENLKKSNFNFYPGVPNHQTPVIYNQHQVFVNLSPSGMYDKTIFEAAACGSLAVNCNLNLQNEWPTLNFPEGDVVALSKKINTLLSRSIFERENLGRLCREFVVAKHSLVELFNKLKQELYG